jgi:hypothetical protein
MKGGYRSREPRLGCVGMYFKANAPLGLRFTSAGPLTMVPGTARQFIVVHRTPKSQVGLISLVDQPPISSNIQDYIGILFHAFYFFLV